MGKYFKYAIGEILLVVIGILIALQINNWNEARKLKSEEHELLGNLKLEFERKLVELEDKNSGRLENVNEINQLLNIIANRDFDYNEKEGIKLMKNLGYWYYINEEFSIIDMLFNSGKINTISNDSLKTKLISWPDKMEEMLEEQRALKNHVFQKLEPLMQEYMSTNSMFIENNENNLFKKYQTHYQNTSSAHLNNLEGLLSDRDFENMIAYKKILLLINHNDSEVLIEDAKIILSLIEKELE